MAASDMMRELLAMNISADIALPVLAVLVAIILLKGFALWKSSRLREKGWFWVLLLFNTAGILPAIYLYLRRDKKV